MLYVILTKKKSSQKDTKRRHDATMLSEQQLLVCKEEVKKNAIRYLKKRIYHGRENEYTDPFQEQDGLKFLLDYELIKDVIRTMNKGVHTIARYCNIVVHYIKQIEQNEQDEQQKILIARERKKYLMLAARAKQEYRATNDKPKRRKKETVLFQKMDEFQIQVNRQYQEYMDFHWNKYSLDKFKDQFDMIHRKLKLTHGIDKTLRTFPPGYSREDAIEKDIPIRIIQQVDRIIQYKNQPNSKCAKIKKGIEPEETTIRQYKQLFYLFIRKHREANNAIFGIEQILNDPDNNIFAFFEQQLEADKKCQKKNNNNNKRKKGPGKGMTWSYIDNMTNALKFFIGCAFSIQELSNKGVNFPFCHYTLSLIEAWANQYRIKDKKEQQMKRKARNEYEYLIQRYGNFYTWGLLRAETNRVKQYEDEPCLNLLLSLYGDFIPRRSSDYAKMVIITDPRVVNDRDATNLDDKYNYLLWLQEPAPMNPGGPLHRFVFNYWKCSNTKGKQAFDIINRTITDALQTRIDNAEFRKHEYMKHNIQANGISIDCQYLLYTFQKHLPITNSKQLTGQLTEIRKRWDIPFAIRDVRHSYATWYQIVNEKKGNRIDLNLLAENMGNSEKMLRSVYFDVQVVKTLTIDDDFEVDKNDNSLEQQWQNMFLATQYDPRNANQAEKRKDFENCVQNTDYVDYDIMEGFKHKKAKKKQQQNDGGHDETKDSEFKPQRPTLSNMPKPTRYFGGLTEPCVGEARKIKYAAIADEFSDDDEDQEIIDAEVVEENLLSICTCEGECRGDCTQGTTTTRPRQRPQRKNNNRVNYEEEEDEEEEDEEEEEEEEDAPPPRQRRRRTNTNSTKK